jgi:antirestriction protein ArdC
MEELVAELGAAFLCADLEIAQAPRADHAAYIDSWLQVLKADKKAIFTAASQASKAADFLAAMQAGESGNQPTEAAA